MAKYFLFLFLTINSFLAQSNGLKGRVADLSDGSPITGAAVCIVELNKYALTTTKGEYSFEKLPVGDYTIKVSSLGYATVASKIAIDNVVQEYDFNLQSTPEDLETVVITGTRTEKRLKEAPVLTQVILPNKMHDVGITTVGAALEREVPGLSFAYFGYKPKLSFQGMNAKYVLILIDGERISGEMDGDIDYFRLNLDNVERIEVVRGASSALYGSNAMGGVINIITKKTQAPLEMATQIKYSKFNELAASTSLGLKTERIASRSSVVYNQTDGYDLPNSPLGRAQEKLRNISFVQRLDVPISNKISIILNGSSYYNRVYDGILRPADHSYAGLGGYAKVLYRFSDSTNFELTYAADEYLTYDVLNQLNDRHNKTSYDFVQNTRLTANIATGYGVFTPGIEFKPGQLYSQRIDGGVKSNKEWVLFLQHDVKLFKQLAVVTGLRGTHHSAYGFNFVPKISLMKNINAFTFRASFGLGYRSPTLKEMYYDFDHMGMFHLMGNTDLRPERSQYFGFSIELSQKRMHHTINIYRNKVNDMISGTWIAPRLNQYINVKSALVHGIDIMEKYMPTNNITIGFGGSYVDAKDEQTGKKVYDINPLSVNAMANYSLSAFNTKIIFEASGKYSGHRSYEPIDEISYEDQPFSHWRFTITQKFKNQISITGGIDNIFNRTDPGSLGNNSPGRRFFVSLRYNLVKY